MERIFSGKAVWIWLSFPITWMEQVLDRLDRRHLHLPNFLETLVGTRKTMTSWWT
jgi:hypothetical protein